MPELIPGIHQIQVNYHNRPLQLYLLLSDTASMLMDTGEAGVPEKDILPYMASINFDPAQLTYVMATHPDVDHTGGLAKIRAVAPAAKFVCGTADRTQIEDPETLVEKRYRMYYYTDGVGPDDAAKAKMLPRCGAFTPFDFTFAGGEELRLGKNKIAHILHLPGHARSHLGVFFPEDKTAIVADAVHGRANCFLDGRAAFAPTYYFVDQYLGTIDQLLALGLERLYSCHWPDKVGKENVAAWLTLSRDYALMAEGAIADTVRAAGPNGITLRDLCLQAKPKLGDWPPERDMETRSLAGGHLERLIGRNQVRIVPAQAGSVRRFVWI